jgi:hypothetical protein
VLLLSAEHSLHLPLLNALYSSTVWAKRDLLLQDLALWGAAAMAGW